MSFLVANTGSYTTGTKRWLLIRDHLSQFGNVLLDRSDFIHPVALDMVGVGNSGSIFPFSLGEMIEENGKAVLQGGAGHGERVSLRKFWEKGSSAFSLDQLRAKKFWSANKFSIGDEVIDHRIDGVYVGAFQGRFTC
jgi:hypothetical protein